MSTACLYRTRSARCARILVALTLALCGAWACDRDDDTAALPPPRSNVAPTPAAAAPLSADQAAAPEPAAAAPSAAAPPSADPNELKPGWSKVVLDDQVPLCVFSDFREQQGAKLVGDAKKHKQTLRANTPVVIGAYGPGCIHEACDQVPSLQCSVTREGNTLTVHTRYWSQHKDGSSCTESCRSINAGSQTPPLEPGKYTIKHGDKTFTLRIPSVMRSPCFDTK